MFLLKYWQANENYRKLRSMTLLFCWPPASQQYFFLTALQQQSPATSQPIIFFSHTTPVAASSTSTANRVTIRWSSFVLQHPSGSHDSTDIRSVLVRFYRIVRWFLYAPQAFFKNKIFCQVFNSACRMWWRIGCKHAVCALSLGQEINCLVHYRAVLDHI